MDLQRRLQGSLQDLSTYLLEVQALKYWDPFRETLFTSVPPSNSLVSVSDP